MKKLSFFWSAVSVLVLSCGGAKSEDPQFEYYRTAAPVTERFIDLDAGNYFGADDSTVEFNTDDFDHITDNPFLRTSENPLSTFSIDVDTAGYSLVRRYLARGQFPPRSAVRIEELINYFDYDYALPVDGRPFSVNAELRECPWNQDHLLARVAVKGREFSTGQRPRANLVFLLDVSGSMNALNKLPLLKSSMALLLEGLGREDRVAICVYAGAAGTVLPPTPGDENKKILAAMNNLSAGGSTAGGAGIQLAYKLAEENYDPRGINRVILCTDGDFNVGVTNRSDLVDLVAAKAQSGVYLTVLGFGLGNYKDGMLKQLASKGNGNYGYIDTIEEARKILGEQLAGTLITIADDVKIQVEFNLENVGAYRLIGYENRILRSEEFNDDAVDAGDIGAGHTVTAFYELIPPGKEADSLPRVDPLRYAVRPDSSAAGPENFSDEYLNVKIRYKLPGESESSLISFQVVRPEALNINDASTDFRFAASAAGFGMLLRQSPYRGNLTFDSVLALAESSLGDDKFGYRTGFLELVKIAGSLEEL